MNALHYCLYKGEVWSNFKVERQVYGLIGFLSTILGLRKYWVKRVTRNLSLRHPNGGIYKVFEREGGNLKRIGTADKDLRIFKK